MKVEVNRNDEMPKAGDLVIDELGNIGILMHNGYIWLLKHSGKPVDVPTLVSYTDSDKLYKFEGTVTPVKYDDEWNTSDEETDDSTWIGEFDLRATYGVGFVESLPDIANGEMTEIRIKYTAEKCE